MMLPVLLEEIVRAELAPLLFRAWQVASPEVAKVLTDPAGTVKRIGDTLVWSGPTGQKVIGGIEMLSDSQARINAAVNGIQSAQVSMQGVLGVVNAVSIATLGVTTLTGAFMAMRLQALNKRIESLSHTIQDVEGKIDAQNKAHLKSSLQFLREYDEAPNDEGKLHRALDEARLAANIYGTLAADEANGSARLPVLNCRGRLYVVSLLTELRCMISSNDSKQALERVKDEKPNLSSVAEACFTKTLKADPERYLHASFQAHGVGLELLANAYQQAKTLGIIDQPQINDANGMFEYVRGKLKRNQGIAGLLRRGKIDDELQKLRYLLACLEETSRIEGLNLMIGEIHRRGESLSELVARLKEWKQKQVQQEITGQAPPVFAFAF